MCINLKSILTIVKLRTLDGFIVVYEEISLPREETRVRIPRTQRTILKRFNEYYVPRRTVNSFMCIDLSRFPFTSVISFIRLIASLCHR